MEIELYRMGVERGKIPTRDEILMPYDTQVRIAFVQPGRNMPVRDKMHVAHPGHVLLDPPEPVAQRIPIAKPDGSFRPIICNRRIAPLVASALRRPTLIRSVNPGNDNVNGKVFDGTHFLPPFDMSVFICVVDISGVRGR